MSTETMWTAPSKAAPTQYGAGKVLTAPASKAGTLSLVFIPSYSYEAGKEH